MKWLPWNLHFNTLPPICLMMISFEILCYFSDSRDIHPFTRWLLALVGEGWGKTTLRNVFNNQSVKKIQNWDRWISAPCREENEKKWIIFQLRKLVLFSINSGLHVSSTTFRAALQVIANSGNVPYKPVGLRTLSISTFVKTSR